MEPSARLMLSRFEASHESLGRMPSSCYISPHTWVNTSSCYTYSDQYVRAKGMCDDETNKCVSLVSTGKFTARYHIHGLSIALGTYTWTRACLRKWLWDVKSSAVVRQSSMLTSLRH